MAGRRRGVQAVEQITDKAIASSMVDVAVLQATFRVNGRAGLNTPQTIDERDVP